ncbi:laccase-5-like [Schistocerca piceifrons]|uniref:laccase-5-like n=1 Tax=Schistocerca piceifrons TaxID=274613 RepID=UPI001F5F4B65|nr:laccase-5-like [Schistocerca piceifrons]
MNTPFNNFRTHSATCGQWLMKNLNLNLDLKDVSLLSFGEIVCLTSHSTFNFNILYTFSEALIVLQLTNNLPKVVMKNMCIQSSEGLYENNGYRYRFRLMFNAALYCPVEVSVDNHKLLVIGSESSYFEPIEVDSFIINGGERYDFVIEANQAPGNYWMRFRGMGDCHKTEESSGKAVEAHAEAVLHYDDAAVNTTLPDGIPTYEEGYASGVLFNPVQETKPDYLANRTIIRVSDLTNIDTDSAMNVSGDPDKTVYLGFDFKSYDSLEIPGPYPQVNNVTFKYPSVPLLTQRNLISSEMFCPNIQAESSDCYDEFCNCPYVIEFDLGDLVEIVLVDTSVIRDQDHPFHMHGYHFHVVAMEPLEEEEEGPVTVGRVKEMNDNGAIHKNLETAPLKDTISVPMRGYTVIRFIADNPGYWFFHCHISNHAELGMGVVLKVGGHDEMVSIPSDFPQCGNWKWTYHEEAAGSRSYGSLLALLLCLSLLEKLLYTINLKILEFCFLNAINITLNSEIFKMLHYVTNLG